MDIEKELQKELKWLQATFAQCEEYTVDWSPCTKEVNMPFGDVAVLDGEVDKINHVLRVYCSDYKECLHTLRHEFFEASFDGLIDPYVELYNSMHQGYEHAFMSTTYKQKEAKIERYVKVVEQMRGEKQ